VDTPNPTHHHAPNPVPAPGTRPAHASTHPPRVLIDAFSPGPFATNCYVVRQEGSASCWLVDVGITPMDMLAFVRSQGLTPAAAILTHTHGDHIAGLPDLSRAWPGTPVFVHEAERGWLGDPERNLTASLGVPLSLPEAHEFLRHDQILVLPGADGALPGETGPLPVRVLQTPGHSPGSISLVIDAMVRVNPSPQMGNVRARSIDAPRAALVGDALFRGSIGRTDFPGSSFETLAASIRQRLYTLPPDTLVLPGHGPPTTIDAERRTNPFVPA
jgi:glyoxylase-like metal-dependent hydrolase (beta-lactamase superfamily II)